MLATRDLNRLFDGFFGPTLYDLRVAPLTHWRRELAPLAERTWPRFDWREEEGSFVFTADLPGLHAADLAVTLEDGVLTVTGERADHTPEGYRAARQERFYGRFERRFKLATPVVADEVTARFDSGVLTIVVPKAPEAKPLKIEVLSGEDK